MIVCIAGIRYTDPILKIVFNDYSLVCKGIERSGYDIEGVISGAAIGADALGEQWAKDNNIPLFRRRADWTSYGQSAGAIRNKDMAEAADAAIIFWDGISSGTGNMIGHMIRLKKPHRIFSTHPSTRTLEDLI